MNILSNAQKVLLTTPRGNRIACYPIGDKRKPTAILTSGIGCGPVFLEEIAAELIRDHRVVYWDYRGHGNSDPAPKNEGYRIVDHAQDLATVVKAFCPNEAPLMVSFSMGVQVQIEWSRLNPYRACAHVFMLGAPRNPLHRTIVLRKPTALATEKVVTLMRPMLNLVQPVVRKALRTPLTYFFARSMGFVKSNCPRHKFQQFVRYATDVPLDAYLRCGAGILQHDGTEVFQSIRQPVLMLAANNDLLIDAEESREFAERLRFIRFGVLEGSHAGTIEQGSDIAKIIRSFLFDCGISYPLAA
jgi:pimeloyl-ACP methyl ester carboxylesterase